MTREEPSNNVQLAATTAPLNSLIVFNKGKFNEDVCSRLRHLQLKSNLINILLSICRRGRAASPLCNMFSMTHFCPTLQSDSLPFNTLWSCYFITNKKSTILERCVFLRLLQYYFFTSFLIKNNFFFIIQITLEGMLLLYVYNDDLDPFKAAGIYFMFLDNCCENITVPYVPPFFQENIEVNTCIILVFKSTQLTN